MVIWVSTRGRVFALRQFALGSFSSHIIAICGWGYGDPNAPNAAADFSKPVNTIAWFAASDGLVSEDHKIAAKLLRLD